MVENAKEAFTTELMNFCYNSPIALVHGLTAALKIDLSQFSTKSLIQTAPDHEVYWFIFFLILNIDLGGSSNAI